MQHDHKIYQGNDGRWRTYIYVEDKRKMITAGTRAKLERRLQEYYSVDHDISMQDLLDDWLRYKALHVSPPTISRIRNTWTRYYAETSIASKPIRSITKMDIDTYIHSTIQETGMTRKEYANFVLPLNQLLDYAVDINLIERNIKRDVKAARNALKPDVKPDDAGQVFSAEEFSRLRDLAIRDYLDDVYPVNSLLPLAMLFCFYTGLRIGEIVVLQWADIDGDVLHVRRMYRHSTAEILDQTKGIYGERTVPIPETAKSLLIMARAKQIERKIRTPYVFSMHKEPLAYSALQKTFYKYSQKAGIKRSSHKARKTYVSTLIDAGVNINTIRRTVGHVDERTTLHNYVYDRATEAEKIQAITDAIDHPKRYKPSPTR